MLAYRMPPGYVIKGVARRLGISMRTRRFRKPEQGMQALNDHLNNGHPVGLQASVYWLPYFPHDMRFHFNAHNLVVYGYQGGNQLETYFISDPTFESPVEADYKSLQRARFVKGMLAPKGVLYYPESIPKKPDFQGPIAEAINSNLHMMLRTPLPWIGIRGMRYVAAKLRRFGRNAKSEARGKLFIGHMVRMQEEIGTGGGGFRFLYAAFLHESAQLLNNDKLLHAASELTLAGDEWRRYALYVAKMLKDRMQLDFDKLADQLLEVAELERQAYQTLQVAMNSR